jgi:integral membrane sensor domain MASE1
MEAFRSIKIFLGGLKTQKSVACFYGAWHRAMRALLTEDVNPPETAGERAWLRYLLRVSAIFLLYFVSGRLGLSIPFTVNNISPIWPASGLALGAVVVWGYGMWPGILLAAFLVNFLSPLPTGSAAFMAIGNTCSALFGGYLLKRVVRFEPPWCA